SRSCSATTSPPGTPPATRSPPVTSASPSSVPAPCRASRPAISAEPEPSGNARLSNGPGPGPVGCLVREREGSIVRTSSGRRVLGVAVGLGVAAGLLGQVGGCAAKRVVGRGRAVGEIDTKNVGGKPVTEGPSGPREGVPDAKLSFENGDGGEMDRLAVNAVSDIYDYWTEQLPANFDGQKFEPL